MRVLSPQEIHHVSGSAAGALPTVSSLVNLFKGLFALFTGGNFIKYLY